MYWLTLDGDTLPPLDLPDGLTREAFESALATARTFCGWHLAPVITHELTLDGPGGAVLLLPSMAVKSVADVTDDGKSVDANAYAIGSVSQALHHRSRWSDKPSGVTLTLTHGFPALPLDVAKALVSMAQSEATGGSGYVSTGSFTYSGQPVSKESTTGLTAFEEGALRPYRLVSRP